VVFLSCKFCQRELLAVDDTRSKQRIMALLIFSLKYRFISIYILYHDYHFDLLEEYTIKLITAQLIAIGFWYQTQYLTETHPSKYSRKITLLRVTQHAPVVLKVFSKCKCHLQFWLAVHTNEVETIILTIIFNQYLYKYKFRDG
jgi:hypothetical protein